MLERIVFHIGTHRTGTTAIQASLAETYDALLSRGVLYPQAGRAGPGHAQLAYEVLDTTGPFAQLPSHRRLVQEVLTARPVNVIISAEDLTDTTGSRPSEWAAHLCKDLEPRHVAVIGYVRPQWEYMESRYAQLVKMGLEWATIEAYVERALTEKRFDYVEAFRPWRERFGDRLNLRLYRDDLLVGEDVVADFWHTIDLGAPPTSRRWRNVRIGARTLEMLRLLRTLLADYRLDTLLPPAPAGHWRPHQYAIEETLLRALHRITARFPVDRRFSALTGEMKDRVSAQLAASNAEFVETYLRGHGRDVFSPPRNLSDISTWSLTDASEEERRFFAELACKTLTELVDEPTACVREVSQPFEPRGQTHVAPATTAARRLRQERRRLRRRHWHVRRGLRRARVRLRRLHRRLRRAVKQDGSLARNHAKRRSG